MLLTLGNMVFGKVTDYFTTKLEHKNKIQELNNKAEIAETVAKGKRLVTQVSNDNAIDLITIADRGILNEVITYTLLAPFMITLFNPLTALLFGYDSSIVLEALTQGLTALKELPDELYYGLLIVFADVFGLRQFLRKGMEVIIAKRVK